jgi:hypothetical protein
MIGLRYIAKEHDHSFYYLDYYLIFSNQKNTPNNRHRVRLNENSLFEVWTDFIQPEEQNWIPFNPISSNSKFSIKQYIQNFMGQYFSVLKKKISATSTDSVEIFSEETLQDFISIKFLEKDKFTDIAESSILRPEILFLFEKKIYFFKLVLDSNRLKEVSKKLLEKKGSNAKLSENTVIDLSLIDMIVTNISCLLDINFIIDVDTMKENNINNSDENEVVIDETVMIEEEMEKLLENTYFKKTSLRLSCRNDYKTIDKEKSPNFLLNEPDIIEKYYGTSSDIKAVENLL